MEYNMQGPWTLNINNSGCAEVKNKNHEIVCVNYFYNDVTLSDKPYTDNNGDMYLISKLPVIISLLEWMANNPSNHDNQYITGVIDEIKGHVNFKNILTAEQRHKLGEPCGYSTGIDDSTTAGYGELDEFGFFEYPLVVNQKDYSIIYSNEKF